MLFRTSRKSKDIRCFSVKCAAPEEYLESTAKRYFEAKLFLEIGALQKDDKLMLAIAEGTAAFAKDINKGIDADIVLDLSLEELHELIDLLKECEAEYLTLCFPNKDVSFEQFLFNCHKCDQEEIMKKGLCYFICTWNKETLELYCHYDSRQLSAEIEDEVRQMIATGLQ